MTRLPEKDVLEGSKQPGTTTGEMKDALGELWDFLSELLGQDSGDKEAARQALGIDLADLSDRIAAKADQAGIQSALGNKADRAELETRASELEEAIARRGTPVGTIEYFAMATIPAGYLKADGAEVGREIYRELFSAIGTAFGEGNGEKTFRLPDLMNRFIQGSSMPGQEIEAGLPNITGEVNNDGSVIWNGNTNATGSFSLSGSAPKSNTSLVGSGASTLSFSAENSNPIFGASDTVQPPALTLLSCIKAFDSATNPGLVDITGLANDVADLSTNKLDKTVNGLALRYVTETFNDGTNWYRKWSDGWLEQGGTTVPVFAAHRSSNKTTVSFALPFSSLPGVNCTLISAVSGDLATSTADVTTTSFVAWLSADDGATSGRTGKWYWFAQGNGSQS